MREARQGHAERNEPRSVFLTRIDDLTAVSGDSAFTSLLCFFPHSPHHQLCSFFSPPHPPSELIFLPFLLSESLIRAEVDCIRGILRIHRSFSRHLVCSRITRGSRLYARIRACPRPRASAVFDREVERGSEETKCLSIDAKRVSLRNPHAYLVREFQREQAALLDTLLSHALERLPPRATLFLESQGSPLPFQTVEEFASPSTSDSRKNGQTMKAVTHDQIGRFPA